MLQVTESAGQIILTWSCEAKHTCALILRDNDKVGKLENRKPEDHISFVNDNNRVVIGYDLPALTLVRSVCGIIICLY